MMCVFSQSIYYQYSHILSKSFIVGADLKKEREIVLGRNWKYNNTLDEGECYITESLADILNLKAGEFFYMRWDVAYLVGNRLWRASLEETSDSNTICIIHFTQNIFIQF